MTGSAPFLPEPPQGPPRHRAGDDGPLPEAAPAAALRPSLRALAEARTTTARLSDDLLTHVPDLGDRIVQRALDEWVEQAADTLRAVSEALEDRLLDLAGGQARPGHQDVGPALGRPALRGER